MNICYSCDDNYIPQTVVSMLSLLKNNIEVKDLKLFIVSSGICDINIQELQNIAKSFSRELKIISFDDISEGFSFEKSGRHTKTVYSKLFFERIPLVKKMIYLDSDTIILNSLKEFWNIDLGNNYFGMVKTISKDYCKSLGLGETEDFYNDGIALVNVELIKKDRLIIKFKNFLDDYNWNPPALSEGLINVVCKGKILKIHPKFNLLSAFFMFNYKELNVFSKEKEFYPIQIVLEALNRPTIIHFLSGWFKRPWEIGCTHPMKHYYFSYLIETKWANKELLKKKLPRNVIIYKYALKIFPIEFLTSLIDFYKKIIRIY